MSWSFRAIGTPENVAKALDAESAKYSGDSKAEFDEALPALKILLNMNVNTAYKTPLRLEASGHATKTDGKVTYSTCLVSLQTLDAMLVE